MSQVAQPLERPKSIIAVGNRRNRQLWARAATTISDTTSEWNQSQFTEFLMQRSDLIGSVHIVTGVFGLG
jgi:hypothetical protein